MLSLQTGIWTGFTFLRLYRSLGYKETASKYSLEDTESAPFSRGGCLDGEEEGSFYFRPIVTPETEIMALRHSSVTDVSDSAPPSAAWAQVMLIIICSSCATIQCSNVFLFIHTQLLHSRCEHINIHTPLGRYVLGQIPVRRSRHSRVLFCRNSASVSGN